MSTGRPTGGAPWVSSVAWISEALFRRFGCSGSAEGAANPPLPPSPHQPPPSAAAAERGRASRCRLPPSPTPPPSPPLLAPPDPLPSFPPRPPACRSACCSAACSASRKASSATSVSTWEVVARWCHGARERGVRGGCRQSVRRVWRYEHTACVRTALLFPGQAVLRLGCARCASMSTGVLTAHACAAGGAGPDAQRGRSILRRRLWSVGC